MKKIVLTACAAVLLSAFVSCGYESKKQEIGDGVFSFSAQTEDKSGEVYGIMIGEEIIVPAKYDNDFQVTDKLILAKKGGNCDLYGKDKSLLASGSPIVYDDNLKGFVAYKDSTKSLVLDNGSIISDYTEILPVSTLDYYVIVKNDLCGIADGQAQILVPADYDRITVVKDQKSENYYFAAEKGKQAFLFYNGKLTKKMTSSRLNTLKRIKAAWSSEDGRAKLVEYNAKRL